MVKAVSYNSILNLSRILFVIFSLQCFIDIGSKVLIFWGIWILSELLLNNRNLTRAIKHRHYYYLFFFCVYYVITLLVSSSPIISNLADFLAIVSPLLMYDLSTIENNRSSKVIIICYTIMCVLNCIYTYYFVSVFGLTNLRKYVGMTNLPEDFYLLKNSFKFVSGLSLIVPVYVYLFLQKKWKASPKFNTIILLLILIFAYTVIYAQFLTAILIMLFGSLMAFGYKNKKWFFIGGFSLVLSLLMLPVIIDALNDSSRNYSVIVTRLDEINATVWGNGGETNDMDARSNLRTNSLNTFMNNFIFGVSINKGTNLEYADVGNHASWIDLLAKYGLFALLLYKMMYIHIRKQMKVYKLYLIPFLFFILGFLNPLWFFQTISVVFLYAPLLLKNYKLEYLK